MAVLAGHGWKGVELAEADLLDMASLEAALADRDVAYHLVHCMRAGDDLEDIDRRGAENFAAAAARTGVKRIVYLGGLTARGADPPRRLTLAFGVKAPDAGVPEFEITPVGPAHARITVTAYWHPAGPLGLLYWYALAPSHGLIFHGMQRAIALRAEEARRDVNRARIPAPP